VTEAAPLPPSECRAWRSRAARRAAAGFPGSWEAFEGFSRLQGACHPQNQDRGRTLIEGAIAKGAGRYLMVEYVMALRAAGDHGRAEQQLPLAVETMRFLIETHVALALTWRWPIVFDAMNEIDYLDRLRDWGMLQRRLDHLLGRPPLLPEDESRQIFRITYRMNRVDLPAAQFQADRAWRAGRTSDRDGRLHLHVAAACGHPEAIRLQARLVLSGELARTEAWSAVRHLIWLNSRTGTDMELLVTLIAWSQPPLWDHGDVIADRNRWIATMCEPRPERQPSR
jgi:hypothetical protein